MRMSTTFAIAASVAVIAGCAHNERQARYDQTSPTYSSTYPTYSTTVYPSNRSTNTSSTAYNQASGAQSQSAASAIPSMTDSSTRPLGSAEDSAIVSQVRQSLNEDATLASIVPSLQISARNGMVTLNGSVSTDEQKKNIEAIVQQIPGVTTVDNQLRVSSSLSATSRTNESGNVYSGSAGSGSEMQRSGESMSQTSRPDEQTSVYSGGTNSNENAGASTNEWFSPTSRTNEENQIYSNTNELASATNDTLSATSTRPDQSMSVTETNQNQATGGNESVETPTQGMSVADRSLMRRITAELESDTSLAPVLSQVKVYVNEGKVTVQGTVRNEQQKRDIEMAIERMTGVSSINSQLQVSANPSASR